MRDEKIDILEYYEEAVIRLLKATSVVGYVAVYDMTKVFDTIRLQSLETTLPLFVTTVLYFLLICLISLMFERRSHKLKEFGKNVPDDIDEAALANDEETEVTEEHEEEQTEDSEERK